MEALCKPRFVNIMRVVYIWLVQICAMVGPTGLKFSLFVSPLVYTGDQTERLTSTTGRKKLNC